MNKANHRIRQQIEGRGSFADVWVCISAEGEGSDLANTPSEWIAAAERGIQSALAAVGRTPPQVSLLRVIYTYVDTTEDAAYAAAFMATAKLLDKDKEFQLSRRDGKWCVISAEKA
ncbi:MAG: hypothetical protein H0T76_08200 [Nannocystis sp.]|nr:hypothetical protein [Nannocystis sp.]MBA3546447.1 hypothetical protein [Nannocystis sp.]